MSPDQSPNARQRRVLRSEFADDPDMREILEVFVQEMPQRVRDLQGSWERKEMERVGRIAHQLKGAGGGYGFPVISEVAARLEQSVESLGGTPTRSVLDQVKSQVESLVDLCTRVSAR